ncbi:MAG: hypothetical protein HRT93_09400 [Piscirickettsiaceae bacterium]|nr:hypothetical protein [Piscirickettsiaceae bacterium]
MIYLIFTAEGFDEAEDIILENKAVLWVNNDVLTDEQLQQLKMANIKVNILTDNADPSNEKSVLSALKQVEQQSPQDKIFVEYY